MALTVIAPILNINVILRFFKGVNDGKIQL
uniref:Uncharacterized protein n=1 Tax=Myoviridae sp. ctYA416 TaxID=2825125 RepID=A0A8S5UTI8_9CAUD|nr:MAG TPA: hypothetical protein [Myoviridae sp. ctYA416]